MKKNISKNNLGFSLIELIVAVLIMAIISGVAVVAFSSVYNSRIGASSRKVVDVLKQTRTKAMGLINDSHDDGTTDVYAKIYMDDSSSDLYIDVCTNYGGVESVIHKQMIANDNIKITLAEMTPSDTKVDRASVGSDVIRIYFKKETGGVSMVAKELSDGSVSSIGTINMLRVENASNASSFRDVILVNITGRCYMDV